MCVLRLSVLGRRHQALVRGRGSVLTDGRALETHGRGRHGLPASRGLLLGLEQTLVPSLTDWSFMRPLLLLELRPVWSHLWTTLRPHAGIHLPCIWRHVVGLLVLGVWGRERRLGSSLWMGHGIGWRLQGRVSCNLWGPG